MRRFLFTLSLAIAFAGTALRSAAQEPTPLSLEACMDYALKHNNDIKNSKIDISIQQAQNNQAIAGAYPKINGKAEMDAYPNLPVTFFPGEFGQFINPGHTYPAGSYIPISLVPKYAGSTSLNGSQVLFDGAVLVALQARNTVMELARQNGRLTQENVRYNVQKAYYMLVIAYRQYDIIKASLANGRKMLHDVNVNHEIGTAEKIDVDRGTVQVNNLATDSLRITSLLTVSEQVLKYNIGMDIHQPIVLTDTAIDKNVIDASSLLSAEVDYTKVANFNLLETQLKANEFNVKRYKLAALPTLSLFGQAGYNYASNTFEDMWRWRKNYILSSTVGLQLSVPIFNGFMRVNQVREAKLNVQKTMNNIDNAKLSIDFQSAQSRTTLHNSLLTLENQRRNLELANTVLDLANRKFNEGVGSNVEVTQAQTDLIQAQNNYFSSFQDVINAQADLQKALGLFNY